LDTPWAFLDPPGVFSTLSDDDDTKIIPPMIFLPHFARVTRGVHVPGDIHFFFLIRIGPPVDIWNLHVSAFFIMTLGDVASIWALAI